VKVLQINSTINSGSTGKIAESIGQKIIQNAGISYIAHGFRGLSSKSQSIKIGNKIDHTLHLMYTRFFDTHGFHSVTSTRSLIKEIVRISPEIIHLHNLHGYYINIELLFTFLERSGISVVWTIHDSWPYTGHCCYYIRAKCIKWITGCSECPLTFLYPRSLFRDNSSENYKRKKELFNLPEKMELVTVSNWLEGEVKRSFLNRFDIRTIYNGLDLEVFKPADHEQIKNKYGLNGKKVLLGVANVWSDGKGLKTLIEFGRKLKPDQILIIVGVNSRQLRSLPSGVIGLKHTVSIFELAEYYNLADVVVNPSIAETFGMVTAEALACGTPCAVYNSSAMPEMIDENTGTITPVNDYEKFSEAVNDILAKGRENYSAYCRDKAVRLFDKKIQLERYYSLYETLI
jgi:putative colanic acid biosynthesis glycosyltransferase